MLVGGWVFWRMMQVLVGKRFISASWIGLVGCVTDAVVGVVGCATDAVVGAVGRVPTNPHSPLSGDVPTRAALPAGCPAVKCCDKANPSVSFPPPWALV